MWNIRPTFPTVRHHPAAGPLPEGPIVISLRPAALCAAIACLFASPAFANPITVDATFGSTIQVRFDGVNPGVGSAGMYNWTSDNNYTGLVYANPATNQFVSFCIERSQFTNSSFSNYTIVPLESAPNPGPNMSPTTADGLRSMWAQYFGGLNTADEAAAFQNAVWFLVSGGSFAPALTSGEQGYYDDFINSATWHSGLASLAVISSGSNQDQLVQVTPGFADPAPVPEPGMLALGLLVIPAVLLRRKPAKA